MDQARQHMEHLFALTDSVALLDMLAGFADLVALSPHIYTRPRLLAATSTMSTAGGQQQQQLRPHPMSASADLPVCGPESHAGSLIVKTGRHAIISTFKQVCSRHHYPPTIYCLPQIYYSIFTLRPCIPSLPHSCRRARARPSCPTTAV